MRLNLSPSVQRYLLVPQDPKKTNDQTDPGIAIHARPALSSIMEDAKADKSLLDFADEIRGMIEEGEAGSQITPAMMRSRGKVGLLFAKALARLVIESWEEVEDPDGSAAPVTADRIEAFLDHPVIYDAFTARYLSRWMTVEQEKNDFAPSPTGTSVAAPNTAKRAPGAAKSAPKRSTRRKA